MSKRTIYVQVIAGALLLGILVIGHYIRPGPQNNEVRTKNALSLLVQILEVDQEFLAKEFYDREDIIEYLVTFYGAESCLQGELCWGCVNITTRAIIDDWGRPIKLIEMKDYPGMIRGFASAGTDGLWEKGAEKGDDIWVLFDGIDPASVVVRK